MARRTATSVISSGMADEEQDQHRNQAGRPQERRRRQRDQSGLQSSPGQTAQPQSNQAQIGQTRARGAQTAEQLPRQMGAAQPQSTQALRQLLHPSPQSRDPTQVLTTVQQNDQRLHFINLPPLREQLRLTYACAGQLMALTWELRSLGLISPQEAQILQIPGSRAAWSKLLEEVEGILKFYVQNRSPAVRAKRRAESRPARRLTWLLKFSTAGLP